LFNLLSVRSREMAKGTLEDTQMGKVSDNYSKKIQERGDDNNSDDM